jgi:acetyl/propionyl-CoA carboxylase alpha subunit
LLALRSFPILGVRTNIPFLINILEDRRFAAGEIDTGFLDRDAASIRPTRGGDIPAVVQAVADAARGATTARTFGAAPGPDPWTSLRGARV